MVIRVSFKEHEIGLYNEIIDECKIIGKSAWMKLAAKEKLNRDTNVPTIQKSSNNLSVINSPDQLFQ